jgi:acyl carrier protein
VRLGEGIGLDSVEVLELVSAIESRFELTLEDEELLPEHFRSVSALAAFIDARIHR